MFNEKEFEFTSIIPDHFKNFFKKYELKKINLMSI